MTIITEFFAEGSTFISAAILIAIFVGFMLERLPPSAVAVAGATSFLMVGYISSEEALAVFSNPAPITIAAMFILSGALVRTGVVEAISGYFVDLAARRGWIAFFGLLICISIGSGLMNNTPLVIVMIPVVIRMAQTLGVASTKLLIPLSYAAVMGGTLTLVGTSTNLLINSVATEQGLAPMGMLEIAPYGLVVCLVGGVTLLLLGPRLLPDRVSASAALDGDEVMFLTELTLASTDDETDDEMEQPHKLADIAALRFSRVIAVLRGAKRLRPDENRELRTGDRVVLMASQSEIATLEENPMFQIGLNPTVPEGIEEDDSQEIARVAAMVSPDRSGAGRFVRDLEWPTRFGVRLLGVSRHGHSPGSELREVRLRPADRVLLEGPASSLAAVVAANSLIIGTEAPARPYRRRRAPVAIACLVGVVGLSIFNFAPIATLALIGVAIVLLTRCIEADDAWSAIDGSTLVLIFAMLAVGRALENVGLIERVVVSLAPLIQNTSPLILLIAVYALTSTLTEIVSNNAVAVILTPLAVSLAATLGVDPRPLVYAIMLAASASFATPIGYQTNTLVYAAGNYRFLDFMRIGLIMNVTVGLAGCIAIWALNDM